jgi:hypothetical protein
MSRYLRRRIALAALAAAGIEVPHRLFPESYRTQAPQSAQALAS